MDRDEVSDQESSPFDWLILRRVLIWTAERYFVLQFFMLDQHFMSEIERRRK